jgi:DNA-binding MarR family transcriptional regulator
VGIADLQPSPVAKDSGDSRPELIQRFLELQPRLRRRLGKALPAEVRAELGGITVNQMQALHAIAQRGPVAMGTLAGCLQSASLSSATQLADRLVKLGLVERSADPEDRRVVRLGLSPRGRELLERMESAWKEGVGEALAGLSDAECATLVRLLERVAGWPAAAEASPWHPHPGV